MAEKPLKVPILLDPNLPSSPSTLPIIPSHIASWLLPSSSSEAGPSRRTALACADNTIWIHTAPTSTSKENVQSPGNIPFITTQAASSPSSPRRNRPTASRNLSYSGRPRNTSSASSIAGKRRTSAFSPPPSALQLPTTTLSSVSASAAGPDQHTHRGSVSDRHDLRESLEKQKERREDGSSMIGLGIGGIGRRGLVGLHGREEQDERDRDRSGATSPKSFVSSTSNETTSNRFGFFGRNSLSADNDDSESQVGNRENEEKIKEVQVDLEMEKETREDRKSSQDRRLIENLISERSPTIPSNLIPPPTGRKRVKEGKGDDVQRIVLRDVGKGKIVQMKVFEEVDSLVVLRDEGLLDIFSLTTLHQTAHIELESPEEAKSSSSKQGLKVPLFWSWKGTYLARKDNIFMFVAHGLPWPCALPSPNGEVTRVVMISPTPSGVGMDIAARLELPGEGGIAICNNDDESYLMHCTPTSLTSYPIIFPSSAPSTTATPALKASPQIRAVSSAFSSPYLRSSTPDPSAQRSRESSLRKSASYTHLKESASSPLLGDHPKEDREKEKGFAKFLARRDWGRKGKEDEKPEEPSPGIGEGKEVERDGGGGWDGIAVHGQNEGAGWKDGSIDVFWTDGKKLRIRGNVSLPSGQKMQSVEFTNGWKCLTIQSENECHVYHITEEFKGPKGRLANIKFDNSTILDATSGSSLDSSGSLCYATPDEIKLVNIVRKDGEAQSLLRLKESSEHSRVARIATSSVESVFTSDSTGNVIARSFANVLAKATSATSANDDLTIDRLDSPVTCLTTIAAGADEMTKEYLVAGDEDGVVRIWTTSPFKLCGSWTLFADPVKDVASLNMPQAGPLHGCALVTSREGTVGLISLKEMDDLFLIPASRTPLRRIFIEQKDILLAYANGKARVWNTQTQEFRRSTGLDAAEDMLQSGDWAEWDRTDCQTCIGRLLSFDLRELGRWLHSSKNNPSHSPLAALRSLLSVFLTFSVDEKVDEICTSNLGIHKPDMSILTGQSESESDIFNYAQGVDVWSVSPVMTGLRQLAIVTLLRPFLDSPDHERWAAEVIAYYTASLPPTTIEPDLQFFAEYYMDSSTDVHQAARMLFSARVGRMSGAEIDATVEVGQENLPSKLPPATRSSDVAANALTMLGGIALNKFETMQPSVLKSIAESVSIFLHSTSFSHLSLAIEICSKGFTTWQSYIDPSDLLRRLFHLSTHKDFASSTGNGISIAAQARLAVLHVASSNPALFMSTLSMDILDAKSVEGRTSIMKLCVYMARKKPNVLENGLPRIAEAVVKSLDPNIGKMRDDVWQAATVILNELVLAFSTIDFHSGTQRLAVGTHEGAVIMYDLKTASRLYVIEPHKHPVSAVTFSPDGRRLITVSLEEGNVTVWKVGSSLSGFFNVGAPPRQGGEKGGPFKRIEFIRADDGPLDSTSALSDIQISWPGNRQARINIKETALTFET
uniref:Uncharacterized protein n=1 Tax=Kwoniella bestiolae CBS 10118 TaxID=1296100 RepID=A0A1B9FU17_9TREE|nr:hypothetical protein I302_07908 [Kwoniella bestiolae CBS 10118]OCF22263.1 hypothetical protein I302_07908 [Kwoniella bestiolae CBS 10118]